MISMVFDSADSDRAVFDSTVCFCSCSSDHVRLHYFMHMPTATSAYNLHRRHSLLDRWCSFHLFFPDRAFLAVSDMKPATVFRMLNRRVPRPPSQWPVSPLVTLSLESVSNAYVRCRTSIHPASHFWKTFTVQPVRDYTLRKPCGTGVISKTYYWIRRVTYFCLEGFLSLRLSSIRMLN